MKVSYLHILPRNINTQGRNLTPVRDLRRVSPRGTVSPWHERRADFAERFVCGAITDTVVCSNCGGTVVQIGSDGYDLVVEQPSLLRGFSSLLRYRRPAILRFPRDIEVGTDVFCQCSLAVFTFGGGTTRAEVSQQLTRRLTHRL